MIERGKTVPSFLTDMQKQGECVPKADGLIHKQPKFPLWD
jgi:hypothetical protein